MNDITPAQKELLAINVQAYQRFPTEVWAKVFLFLSELKDIHTLSLVARETRKGLQKVTNQKNVSRWLRQKLIPFLKKKGMGSENLDYLINLCNHLNQYPTTNEEKLTWFSALRVALEKHKRPPETRNARLYTALLLPKSSKEFSAADLIFQFYILNSSEKLNPLERLQYLSLFFREIENSFRHTPSQTIKRILNQSTQNAVLYVATLTPIVFCALTGRVLAKEITTYRLPFPLSDLLDYMFIFIAVMASLKFIYSLARHSVDLPLIGSFQTQAAPAQEISVFSNRHAFWQDHAKRQIPPLQTLNIPTEKIDEEEKVAREQETARLHDVWNKLIRNEVLPPNEELPGAIAELRR